MSEEEVELQEGEGFCCHCEKVIPIESDGSVEDFLCPECFKGHEHEYEISDMDSEMDRVRFTCHFYGCGTEYMITYSEYARAHGKPVD